MWDWLSQNKQWVFEGIGVAVLGYIWWMWKSLFRSEPSPTPTNAVTQSPSLTQSPSITVSPTIHVVHPEPTEPPKPQPRPAIPRPGPNFICLGPETIRAKFFDDTREQYFHRSDDEKGGTFILVVCFRNEPKSVWVENVRVNVIYQDNDGKEIGTGIARASWLGEHMDMMDFHVGDSHCAVLAVLDRVERELSNLTKIRRQTYVESDAYLIRDSLKTIEVRLLSGNDLLMEPVRLSFSITDGRPTATVI